MSFGCDFFFFFCLKFLSWSSYLFLGLALFFVVSWYFSLTLYAWLNKSLCSSSNSLFLFKIMLVYFFSQLLVLMDKLSDVVLLVCFHVYLFIPVFINFNHLIHAIM